MAADVPESKWIRPNEDSEPDADARKRIEEALERLEASDPGEMGKYERCEQKWDKIVRPLIESLAASEEITEEDLAIRINTRD